MPQGRGSSLEIVKTCIEHFYPGAQTPDIPAFHYAIRGKVKRENPELLQRQVRAIVSSGRMKPKATTKTIAELASWRLGEMRSLWGGC